MSFIPQKSTFSVYSRRTGRTWTCANQPIRIISWMQNSIRFDQKNLFNLAFVGKFSPFISLLFSVDCSTNGWKMSECFHTYTVLTQSFISFQLPVIIISTSRNSSLDDSNSSNYNNRKLLIKTHTNWEKKLIKWEPFNKSRYLWTSTDYGLVFMFTEGFLMLFLLLHRTVSTAKR